MTAPEVAERKQELCLAVTLTVTHRVVVTVDATVNRSVESIRDEALAMYRALEKSAWRDQFANRTDVSVFTEPVEVGELHTTTRRSW